MGNKEPLFKFAEVTPPGTIALICGIGAVSTLFSNLVIACFVGAIGFLLGAIVLRMKAERLEKVFAAIGAIFSVIPLIYALILFAGK